MWKKCPICNGTGKQRLINIQFNDCKTCDGKGVISELTGEAPTWQGECNSCLKPKQSCTKLYILTGLISNCITLTQ